MDISGTDLEQIDVRAGVRKSSRQFSRFLARLPQWDKERGASSSRKVHKAVALKHIPSSPTALLAALVALAGLAACTEKPKVERAGVAEPTVSPTVSTAGRQAGAGSQSPANTFEKVPGTDPIATPSSAPEATPTLGTPAATPSAVGTGSPSSTGSTPVGGGVPPGDTGRNGSVTVSTSLEIPKGLSVAAQDADVLKKACEQGQATACLRAGAFEAARGKRDEAKKLYMLGCVKDGVVTPTACKPQSPASPATSDARGCYEAGLLLLKDGDKASAKSALQCACDLAFAVACDDVKSL